MEISEFEGAEYVTVPELARSAGVKREAIYNAIREERLTAVKKLGRTLIPRADAEGYRPQPYGARPGAGRPKKEKGDP